MSMRQIALLSALIWTVGSAAAEKETSPLPDITVTAPRPPTDAELAGEAVPNFIASHATPSALIGQLTRWRTPLCPHARGLDQAFNDFVTARIRAVARSVGAPVNDSSACKANMEILFTLEPQKLLTEAVKQDSRILGFHYPHDKKALMTFTRPIQGWYLTSTRNFRGVEILDDPMPLGAEEGGIGSPMGQLPGSKIPPGEPGSRLTNRISSQVVFAFIVVDANRIAGMTIGAISDYLSVLALSQSKTPDACGQLPSIIDMMASNCTRQEKVMQLTAGDIAFLKALYRTDLEQPLGLEKSDIQISMMRQFNGH